MNSLWNDEDASRYRNDPLGLRVYTSQLLGQEPSLVLHGGGNTSVKAKEANIFGENEELLFVKGSGWDLATIERAGFAPVKMDVLLRMAQLKQLSDTDMVRVQRTAMTDPGAPNPSVEAILHAIIPFGFVDHTHADAVVTITNTEKGEEYIHEIYGDRVFVIPYVMPGFILAKKVYELTRNIDWKQYEGLILMNHGVFTFDDDAKRSYERMIRIVSEAENFLIKKGIAIFGHGTENQNIPPPNRLRNIFTSIQNFIKRQNKKEINPKQHSSAFAGDHGLARGGMRKSSAATADSATKLSADEPGEAEHENISAKTGHLNRDHGLGRGASLHEHLLTLSQLRKAVSKKRGAPILARQKTTQQDVQFSNCQEVNSIATRGPLTPDHVIRTKRTPVVISDDIVKDIDHFGSEYSSYFKRHANGKSLTCLDQAPRWAVWPGRGTVAFGSNIKEVNIISDIINHTVWAIEAAEVFDRWKALPEKDIFDVEYWELEQVKLKKGGTLPVFQGKIALVTGAASGIGRACVEALYAQGSVVAALDINPDIENLFHQNGILGLICDVTNEDDVRKSVETVIAQFGGLDILVSNAGIFPVGESIENVQREVWRRSIDINLSSHQQLLKQCIPFLSLGIDSAIVIIASKNVSAPGPGASAYSVAKAGLTQLARIAALELGSKGIRVNVVHPNQVFDTALWTAEVLANRAQHYGMSVEEYKTNNVLKTEITSFDVAQLVCAMVSPVFSKTTGAQVPIDGGNERVI